jgi:hypothetical protein
VTHRRLRLLFAAGAFVATLVGRPCLGSEPGYDVWFAGRVLSVDPHRERVRIARGPTETAGRGVEECVVAGTDLRLVRPGMLIEAQADTRRRPWRLLHLRVMERKERRPGVAAPIAFIARIASDG